MTALPKPSPTDAPDAIMLSLAAVKIRKYRRDQKLSAAALGEKLGVSQAAVLFWEHGKRKPCNSRTAQLHLMNICSPNDWHEPAPVANDDEAESAD